MDLGTFREITKNLSDDTILYMSLAEVVKGDVIERDEIEADVEDIEVDKDDNGRPFLWLMDCKQQKNNTRIRISENVRMVWRTHH